MGVRKGQRPPVTRAHAIPSPILTHTKRMWKGYRWCGYEWGALCAGPPAPCPTLPTHHTPSVTVRRTDVDPSLETTPVHASRHTTLST